ncbi:MAG: hypothetical protein ACRD2A_07460, partial [Vicinamibacterales bacterium]
ALGHACIGIDSGRNHPISPSSASGPRDSLKVAADPAAAIQTVRMMAGLRPQSAGLDPVLGLNGGVSGPTDVSFPPRSEPLLFRNALEAKYRDGLRRGAVLTFVDQEGTVVWVQEYIRYRVNLCSHAEAVLRVFRQIDGQGFNPSVAPQRPRYSHHDRSRWISWCSSKPSIETGCGEARARASSMSRGT